MHGPVGSQAILTQVCKGGFVEHGRLIMAIPDLRYHRTRFTLRCGTCAVI